MLIVKEKSCLETSFYYYIIYKYWQKNFFWDERQFYSTNFNHLQKEHNNFKDNNKLKFYSQKSKNIQYFLPLKNWQQVK